MTSSNTAARVLRPAVSEYVKLKAALNDLSNANPGIKIGHFKLLRIPGSDRINATHYPYLSAIVASLVEARASNVNRHYRMKTSPVAAFAVRSALAYHFQQITQ